MLELAQRAIDGGADVIGMAGGDGSQALVASVAAAADVPLVCIPAGTRNHFALDVGLDRNDVVGALDAFDDAVERRIDLAEVSGRVFVNNVFFGVYAKIIQSPEYRDAKRQRPRRCCPRFSVPTPSRSTSFHRSGRHPPGRRPTHPGLEQPLPADNLTGFGTRPGSTPARSASPGQGPRRHRRRRLRSSGPAGHVDHFEGWTRGSLPPSPWNPVHPSKPGSTARPCCSTHRWSSASCATRCGSASPPRRPATPRRTEIALDLVDAQRPGPRRRPGHTTPIDEAQR